MRGTHQCALCVAIRRRFIPAHAGNTTTATRASARRAGSSPRMRGTRCRAAMSARSSGFIPAHAGNTATAPRLIHEMSVHPRACGEHRVGLFARSTASGSSPRMRGTQVYVVQHQKIGRFIPAHAGNTDFTYAVDSGLAVHPRACGEHARLALPSPPSGGSSPRMRGTRRPARRRGIGRPVHPRACGEHETQEQPRTPSDGSSPRMRGTLRRSDGRGGQRRFIPAHAGNTRVGCGFVGGPSVHPRACGEHLTSDSQT